LTTPLEAEFPSSKSVNPSRAFQHKLETDEKKEAHSEEQAFNFMHYLQELHDLQLLQINS
jgi:hypothetical protein